MRLNSRFREMKNILITMVSFVPFLTFGTNQYEEKIIYNGTTNTLFTLPLPDELRQKVLFEIDPVTGAISPRTRISTACWRGYIGTWEYTNDTLFLIRLQDGVEHEDIPANQLIHGAEYPLKADWFTGELRIGIGRRGMNVSSSEVFLSLTNGVVSAEPEVIDRDAEQDAFENELDAMKDSPDQLEHDLYEYIYHYIGPWQSNLKFDGLLEVASENLDEIKFPYCRTFNRSDESSPNVRYYIRFLPTTEPRLYKVESIHKKLNSPNSIHYVGFFKDMAFSFSGQPDKKTKMEKTDGRLNITKTTNPEKADKEAFETMVRFRKTLEGKTIIPDESAFNVSIALSANVLSTNDPMTVDLTVSNRGSEPISLCAYDLDVEFLLEDAGGTNIAELGRSDWIVRDVTFPVILKAGESKVFGQIQAKVRNGSWTDFSNLPKGPFPEYKGVGLEVKDALLESGYLLNTIPGDYFGSVQIRIRRDDDAELKFVSDKQKIHIN